MKKDFIFTEIDSLKGVGPQLSKYLKKKKIEKIKDVILNLPYSETDRSKIYKLKELEVGKIQTIKVYVKKFSSEAGKFFYYNKNSKESFWEKPIFLGMDDIPVSARTQAAARRWALDLGIEPEKVKTRTPRFTAKTRCFFVLFIFIFLVLYLSA